MLLPLFLVSQTENSGIVKGFIKDEETGESLIGANVVYSEGKGTVTDIDGNFTLSLEPGNYILTVSYIGFLEQKKAIVVEANKTITVSFSMKTKMMKEVEVVADIAINRETPVAFSTIDPIKIQEELVSRDLPMILNSTPGVYATEQGGGAGDARITIRGFDQRNVAVLVDGVPVNDMENGQVYWSNWSGLGDITRSVQVQRGLGASKLALASVGGTMNTITRGIESKAGGSVKQELGNNHLRKTTVSYNSGLLKNGYGFTFAVSKLSSNGWVDQAWNEVFSYFLKVQKRIKANHLLSFSVNGAPQSHGQRSARMQIPVYNESYAKDLGLNVDSIYKAIGNSTGYTTEYQRERGLRYNSEWGYAAYYKDEKGITRRFYGPVNRSINYYHKPLFNVSHSWNVTDNVFWSNVAYMSIGKGGGTSFSKAGIARDTADGQYSLQTNIDANQTQIDAKYSTMETKSSSILQSSNNEHRWFGLLSTLNLEIAPNVTFIGGVDLRNYTGYHFRTVYDLLGGDYYIDQSDKNQPYGLYKNDPNFAYSVKRTGDKIGYNNIGYVNWGGLFGQLEYKKDKWSTFVNLTVSETGYRRKDFFAKQDVILSDTTFRQIVGWGDTLIYDGSKYLVYNNSAVVSDTGDTKYVVFNNKVHAFQNSSSYTIDSDEAETSVTDWAWFLGYTVKAGANYNVTEKQNVFFNLGYLSIAPKYNNVFDNNNNEFLNTKNQKVIATELGYGFHSTIFSANVNGYYTIWQNRPPDRSPTISTPEGVLTYNINGMTAIHRGGEVDFIVKVRKDLDVEGVISLGDWQYNSAQLAYLYDNDGVLVDSIDFSAKGVHVGDAAQTQLGGSIRYEPIKNLYFKVRGTYFGRNYSYFDPLTLTPIYDTKNNLIRDDRDKESWKMPDYFLTDIHLGYGFRYEKLRFNVSLSVINALNTVYISDAQNNEYGAGFGATSAGVYFGQGRRYNVSFKVSF